MIPIAKSEASVDLTEMVEQIQSRNDFVTFVGALQQSLREKPDAWENRDLPAYLGAVEAWVDDMYGYYQGQGQALPLQPSWKMLGQILLAAKTYE